MVQGSPIVSPNEQLARRINREARQNSQSPYAGKLVGIANGQVVVVADSWREVLDRLRQVEPDPAKCYGVDASADYERVEEIWFGLEERMQWEKRNTNSVFSVSGVQVAFGRETMPRTETSTSARSVEDPDLDAYLSNPSEFRRK